MKPWERYLIVGGIAVAGVFGLIAAFRPTLRGEPFDVVFFLGGVVCFILAGVAARKRQT